MYVFFFFKQKTAYEMRISDWSSDVCSSDLPVLHLVEGVHGSWQAPPGRRHRPCRDHRRGPGPAPRSPGPEGMRGRSDTGKPSAQKKHGRGWGQRRMRYPASEKLEIIRTVEQSHLSAKRTRSEEHTSEFQQLMSISYAVLCLKKKKH